MATTPVIDPIAELKCAAAAGEKLLVRKDTQLGRYVIAVGASERAILCLGRQVTADFDAEFAGDAVWEVTRWSPGEGGVLTVVLRRTSPRHGRASTYQYHGCHCPRCRAANTALQLAWRNSAGVSTPKAKRPVVHGAGCRKRGCPCEVGKQAERDRQKRSRLRRRVADGGAARGQRRKSATSAPTSAT